MIARISDKFYFFIMTLLYGGSLSITEITVKGTVFEAAPTVKNTLFLLVLLQSALFLMLLLVEKRRLLNRADDIIWLTLLVAGAGGFFITLFRIDYSNRVLITGLFYLLILLALHAKRVKSRSEETLFVFDKATLPDMPRDIAINHVGIDDINNLPKAIKLIIPSSLDKRLLIDLVNITRDKDILLIEAHDFAEAYTGRVAIQNMSAIDITKAVNTGLFAPFKRLIDIIISASLLASLSPLMLLTIIAIRLESSGAAFYSQKRVGQGGVPFTIFKFRSMTQADKNAQSAFATDDEYRITRIGSIIRRSRIDELPQLWNVLRGDMSLVGPRPEQVYFVDQFLKDIPSYGLRHLVRPGITGWAQVMQGYAADTESTAEKLSYDLFYIKQSGLAMDLLIIIRTLKTILTGFGSR